MKNWLILGDFKARIKNRKAMRDVKEKTGVSKVVRNVLKIPKLSSLFSQYTRLLKCIPLNFM